MWLEDNWDHKFLVWQEDPWGVDLAIMDGTVVKLPFNPTAEKMADHLLRFVAPVQLVGTGVRCTMVRVEETRKCSAAASFPSLEFMDELYQIVEDNVHRTSESSSDASR